MTSGALAQIFGVDITELCKDQPAHGESELPYAYLAAPPLADARVSGLRKYGKKS